MDGMARGASERAVKKQWIAYAAFNSKVQPSLRAAHLAF
jgi:hypothetical protein